MTDFKSYIQRSSIGYVHSFECADQITNPTVTGQIVSLLPLVQKSSLQQTSVFICNVVDGSPDRHLEKKLKILFIGDAAEIVATLPISVGDDLSFRSARFMYDPSFEIRNSFYETMLCIGSPPSLNRLKNMFFRKKDSEVWISLVGLTFQYLPTNIDDYVPVHRDKSCLYMGKSVNENDSINSPCRKDVPFLSLDEQFESLQSSLQISEKSPNSLSTSSPLFGENSIDAGGESFKLEFSVTDNASQTRKVPMETNDAAISATFAENSVSDESNYLNSSDSLNIAMNAETTEDSISFMEDPVIISKQILNYLLYLVSTTVTKYSSKSNELEDRSKPIFLSYLPSAEVITWVTFHFAAKRNVINNPQNAFVRLPSEVPETPFFIRVSILVTFPYITCTSSVTSILSLISFHCSHCLTYFPFPNVKLLLSDEEILAICTKCDNKEIRSIMNPSIICEFLLQSESGSFLPAVVMNENAENFFGCTVSDLCLSPDAQIKIRHIFDSFKKKQELLVLKVIPVCYGSDEECRYHIMC